MSRTARIREARQRAWLERDREKRAASGDWILASLGNNGERTTAPGVWTTRAAAGEEAAQIPGTAGRRPKAGLDVPAGAAPFQPHSPTSRAAAESVAGQAPSLRRAVYRALLEAGEGGCTDEEIQALLGLSGSTQRPRRVELVEAGLVRDSGRKRTTGSGRLAVVWVAVPTQIHVISSPLLSGDG